jgi:hypothetical protein
MFSTQEFARDYPILSGILNLATVFFYLAVIWVIGRMGDNINKIRKMLEQELKNRQ